MEAKDVIQRSADMSEMVLIKYLDDLTDAELMRRPGPGCNHLAWQIGHLISSEAGMLNAVRPGAAPGLPAGFSEKHSKDTKDSDDPSLFYTKQEYLVLFTKVRAASKDVLAGMSDSDLEQPGPEPYREWFPTMAAFYLLIANHPLMHAGQFVPVRRALDKPVVI